MEVPASNSSDDFDFHEEDKKSMLLSSLIIALTEKRTKKDQDEVLSFFFLDETRNREDFDEAFFHVIANSKDIFELKTSNVTRGTFQASLIPDSVPQVAEMLEQYHNTIASSYIRTNEIFNFLDTLKDAIWKAKFFRDRQQVTSELIDRIKYCVLNGSLELLESNPKPSLKPIKPSPEKALEMLEKGAVDKSKWDPSNRISASNLQLSTLLAPLHKKKEMHTGHVQVGFFQ